MAFDNTCKFLAETFTDDITTWLLGQSVTLSRLETKELSLEPIRPDALVLLQSESLILHIEFQVEPKASIPFRMADYRLRCFRKYPDKAMRQVVVYLRYSENPLVEQTTFELETLHHSFEVIRIWEQPASLFLQSEGLLPFAVLAERGGNRSAVLQAVADRIKMIPNGERQSNVAASTAILAGLVLKQDLIRSVLREDIMRESVIYQEIYSAAEEQGLRKGEVNMILKQLNYRVGPLEPNLQAQIETLNLSQVEELGKALLDFSGVADLVAWLQVITD